MKTLAELLREALPSVQAKLGGVTKAELARRAGIEPANLYRAKGSCREVTLARVLDLGGLELYIGPKEGPPKGSTS